MKLEDLIHIMVLYEAGFSEEIFRTGKFIGEDDENIYIATKIIKVRKKYIRKIRRMDEVDSKWTSDISGLKKEKRRG